MPILFRKISGLALAFSKVEGKNLEHLSGEEKSGITGLCTLEG